MDGATVVTSQELLATFKRALSLMEHFGARFLVPDDFLPDHPERDKMVAYLKGRSWRGTDSGAAILARIPVKKLKAWREIPEFREMEELADQACTDLPEEMALLKAYMEGDPAMIHEVLRARRSEKYGNKQEITGKDGGPVEFTISLGGMPRPQKIDG